MMEAVSSIAADSASILLGSPEDPGLTFDQLFDWHQDHTGVLYWNRGSRTFEQYLRTALWDQTESGGSTGYRDHGWSRVAQVPDPESLLGAKHRMHAYSNHNHLVPSNCELLGISVGDLRRHLGLDVRRRPFSKNSDEHARSRTVSGCLRHCASLVPEPGQSLNTHNGLDCAMDTGGGSLSRSSLTRSTGPYLRTEAEFARRRLLKSLPESHQMGRRTSPRRDGNLASC